MYTPNHSHKGSHQLVISLGGKRTLTIGKKKFPMKNGDAIIFGGSTHGIPKEPNAQEGRISIATFMIPEQDIRKHINYKFSEQEGSSIKFPEKGQRLGSNIDNTIDMDILLEHLNKLGLSDEELAKKLQETGLYQ